MTLSHLAQALYDIDELSKNYAKVAQEKEPIDQALSRCYLRTVKDSNNVEHLKLENHGSWNLLKWFQRLFNRASYTISSDNSGHLSQTAKRLKNLHTSLETASPNDIQSALLELKNKNIAIKSFDDTSELQTGIKTIDSLLLRLSARKFPSQQLKETNTAITELFAQVKVTLTSPNPIQPTPAPSLSPPKEPDKPPELKVEEIIKEMIQKCPKTKGMTLLKTLKTIAKHSQNSQEKELVEKTIARYDQIATALPSKTLSPLERIKIAFLIETEIPKINSTALTHFKKKDYDIPLSILVTEGNIYLRNIKKLGSGGYKKVTSAVCLPLLSHAKTAHLVAQSVGKKGDKPKDLERHAQEMKIHTDLKDSPGIWPLHFWFQYPTRADHTLEKLSSVMSIADGDLFLLENQKLSLQEQMSVSSDLITGLNAMHEKNYVHGDIKDLNALFKRDEDGKLTAGLIDFGFTFNTETDNPPRIYTSGFYGTVVCTPPELFGNKQFGNDPDSDYFKVDVWALGLMLYQLHFKTDPPWTDSLYSCYENKLQPVTKKQQQEMNRQVSKLVEKPLKELQKKKSLSNEEKFEMLIYQMMRLRPDQRIGMKQALEEINQLVQAGQKKA